MTALIIIKGGILLLNKWDTKKQVYVQQDISNLAFRYLFESCSLGEITLKDIFLLINQNLAMFDAIFGNWCKEIIEEGLSGKSANSVSQVEFLELCWRIYDLGNSLEGFEFPELNAIRLNENELEEYVGLDFTPAYDLIDFPVKLKAEIYEDLKTEPFRKAGYTLGQILYGILWELSFYGNTKDRDATEAAILAEFEKEEKQ